MLKKYNPKYSVGSLYICTKCGQSFNEPQIDFAEKLKTDLRAQLKSVEAHTKVRVMTSGCIGVCQNNEQTFGYYPHDGKAEIYTVESDYSSAQDEILKFVKTKV